MSPESLVEQLAEQHAAHLRWLQARLRGRLAPDEIEDVLQAAYARALAALSTPSPARPRFERPAHATAWLRTVALNLAHDLARERRGRPGEGRAARPADVALDDSACSDLVADVDVESEVLGSVQLEAYRPQVREAIARLDAGHRQILQLRYGRDLPPAAIMVLVGIDRRQWDGRHTRALKAFGRALARLPIGRECRQTRSLLKASPAALLQPGAPATDHIASCLTCAAFSNAARFAMGALPLPLAIEAWRLHAAEVLTPASSAPVPNRAPTGADIGSAGDGAGTAFAAPAKSGAATTFAAAGAVLATAATMALAGLAAGSSQETTRAEPAATASRRSEPAASKAQDRARLAVHLTPRQALERTARAAAHRRAAAQRRAASRPRERGAAARPNTNRGGGRLAVSAR